MTKPDHVNTLIADVRDCAKRAHHLGYFQRAESLAIIANELEQMSAPATRPSIPPPGSDNQVKRATASQHFQAARDLLAGILGTK